MPTTVRERGNLRATLGSRGFRRLVGVRVSSQFVDGLFQAAMAGSLLFNPEKNTSAQAIAVGFAIMLLPYSIIGPYVGVFLDRWSRRTVLYGTNLIRAGLVLPAALLIWYGQQSVPYAVVALLIIGLNRFFLSGLSAAQPHVVAERLLVTANAVATTLGTLVLSAGLGLAAVILTFVLHKSYHGYAVLASLAALGYVASALLARRSFTVKELGPDDFERPTHGFLAGAVVVGHGMVAGLRHLGDRPAARYALTAQAVHRVLYGVLTIATLLLYRHYFSTGNNYSTSMSGLAQVVAAGGLGALLAAVATPPATRFLGGWRWVALLLATTGVLLPPLGLPFRTALLVAATFVINLASQSVKIVVDTTLQRDCEDDFRGRVFSVNDTTYNLAFVVGLFAGASMLPANGRSPGGIVLISAGYLLLAAGYGLAAARLARRVHIPPVKVAVGSGASRPG